MEMHIKNTIRYHLTPVKIAITEDKMVGWYHQLNRHEFERTLGDSERQGSLACCSPRGHKELGMT